MARARDAIRVIAINDAAYPCWFADVAYAADAHWWVAHRQLPGFPGLKVSIAQAGHPPLPAEISFLRNTGLEGFDPDPTALRTGRNGGFQSVHLAAHLGATRIVLVGFDMHGTHWFGEHPRELQKTLPIYGEMIRYLEDLGTELGRLGLTIVNATPKSALQKFKSVNLETELGKTER